ncbi:MAG TPA: PAS domain-containing protein [Xanthobacteraceae bacterium]|jgi:PAS domain S-box-containing protein|nr:PAS domain-containing protein [Xanthobacteraceae bacterium]
MANSDQSASTAPSPQAGEGVAGIAMAPAGWLAQIVDHLPIALTVQDHDGRFILANATAAANLAIPVDALIGASPADFLPPAEAAERREWEVNLIRSRTSSTVEEQVTGRMDEETWLTWRQPVCVGDQTLLLTSSLDITARKEIEDELLRRVNFDDLTGLPNRVLIREHVDRILPPSASTSPPSRRAT